MLKEGLVSKQSSQFSQLVCQWPQCFSALEKKDGYNFTGLLTLKENRTGIAFLRFPWLLVTVSLAVSNFMHVDDPTFGKWLHSGFSSFLQPRLSIPAPCLSSLCIYACNISSVWLWFTTSFLCLLVCLFYYKMMLYWRSPGMGCTAPVDIYYLKAPSSSGKHKITQNIDLLLSIFLLH